MKTAGETLPRSPSDRETAPAKTALPASEEGKKSQEEGTEKKAREKTKSRAGQVASTLPTSGKATATQRTTRIGELCGALLLQVGQRPHEAGGHFVERAHELGGHALHQPQQLGLEHLACGQAA